ncbi:hypothetical protein [Legionella waltersii]|uniref:Uncharacterized protein n=1 Tax=Legionella waltersii TaxID=66969 RepID=A0A0W1AP38_9GAMM|nr:hypothetical protein [Legionella waltersii]KTD83082.1 hypothetical protein Lwal_0070 [Legionella waltersii]SNV08087.1 Uncharacterised protein [Legionella waltersii]
MDAFTIRNHLTKLVISCLLLACSLFISESLYAKSFNRDITPITYSDRGIQTAYIYIGPSYYRPYYRGYYYRPYYYRNYYNPYYYRPYYYRPYYYRTYYYRW